MHLEVDLPSPWGRNRHLLQPENLSQLPAEVVLETDAGVELRQVRLFDPHGRLVLDQRIRTVAKAHAAMIERVATLVGDRPASIAVHHVDNHDDAASIGAALTTRLPQAESLVVTDMGPVLAVHVGSGAVGVIVNTQD